MPLSKSVIASAIQKVARSPKDTGCSEVQITLLTERIKQLTHHFKTHKKDFHSQRGLFKLISQRKKLLNYMKNTIPERYQKIIQQLSLRK